MKKTLLVIIILLAVTFTGKSQSMNCPNFCILNIGNLDTISNQLDVTIYNGDTVFVNYPIVVVVNSLGDTIANIGNQFFYFGHLAGDTLVHTIPTTADSIPGFTGTVYYTDPTDSTTCMYSYPMACTVGINELASSTSVNIFPNPASTVVNFSINGTGTFSASLHLYDVTGKLVKSLSTSERNFTIERGDLVSGIYFARIVTDGAVLTRKIILE